MGWDDNGLNVERRVQLTYGVTCDPSLPYDPAFVAPETPPKQPIPISRPNFVALCGELTEQLEQAYFELWTRVGLSVDWRQTYTTIGAKARRTSQRGFLGLFARRSRPPRRGADALGRRLQDLGRAGRARGSRAPGCVPPHRLPPHQRRRTGLRRDDAARADRRVRRARRASRRRALQAPLRHDGPLAALRRRGPGRRSRAR